MKASLAPALPNWLYITLVFVPGTTRLPLMLPTTLPMKNGAVILPTLFKEFNMPTDVIFG